MLLAEPAIVEKEKVESHICGIVDDTGQYFIVKVEISGFPIVHQRHMGLRPVVYSILAGPAVKAARYRTFTLIAVCVQQRWRSQGFAFFQGILPGIRIDT